MRSLALAACGAFTVAAWIAGPAAAEETRAIVIRDVSVVDVEAGRILPGRDVVIQGDRIAAIRAAGAPRTDFAGAEIISGAGLYLMPGLFDAHVHLIAEMDTFPPLLVANGVTCVRDTGAMTHAILDMRRRAATGETLSPEIIATGAIIDGVPPVWPFSEGCDTPEEARAAVAKLAEAGVDQIKVYSLLKPEVYAAAVEEARRRGLKVTGHVPRSITLSDAIAAGQSCIEHLDGVSQLIVDLVEPEQVGAARNLLEASFAGWMRLGEIDRETLRTALRPVADSGVMHCPTVVVLKGIGQLAEADAWDDPRIRYIPHTMREFWSSPQYQNFGRVASHLVEPMLEVVRELHELGAPMMIGSDLANCFVFPGFSVHEEMMLWEQAGVPTAGVLRAATIVPAKFCGVEERLGTVEAGKTASLVLLRANPLERIANVAEIESVFLRGRRFDRAALDQMMQEIAANIEHSAPGEAADDLLADARADADHAGRYTMKFEQWDAGHEDFVIVKRPEGGATISVQFRPSGGGQIPSDTVMELDADFNFTKITWCQLTQVAIEAVYTLEDGAIVARATRAGEPLPEQRMPAPDNVLFSPPSYITDFAILQALRLAPGESRQFQAASFGFPTWQVSLAPLTITRHDDEPVTLPGGEARPAHRYTSTMTLPMGQFNGVTWIDPQTHIPLLAEMRMPFGKITSTLAK